MMNIESRSRFLAVFTSTLDILNSIFCGSLFNFYDFGTGNPHASRVRIILARCVPGQ